MDKMNGLIDVVWLTVNRMCNFRCPWCYAEGTKYLKSDDMSFDLAKNLIDFSKTIGTKNIMLIGGEPTYHPHFFALLKYINECGICANLVTNGYKFKDMDFVRKVEESGLKAIGFSIKAANTKQQKELTKVDAFEDIKQAIKNLSKVKDFKVGYSTVISKDNIDNLEEFAQLIADLDFTKHLRYSLCGPIISSASCVDKNCMPDLRELIEKFTKKFDKICKILGGKVSIEQSLALCLWPKEFIDKLKENRQISFGCHLQCRNGLVFDKDGKIIPCNSLPSFPIGQYDIDFTNKEEFEKFWMSKELVKLYDKIYEYPVAKCQACDEYLECGGGCPLKWFAYSAKELLGS